MYAYHLVAVDHFPQRIYVEDSAEVVRNLTQALQADSGVAAAVRSCSSSIGISPTQEQLQSCLIDHQSANSTAALFSTAADAIQDFVDTHGYVLLV